MATFLTIMARRMIGQRARPDRASGLRPQAEHRGRNPAGACRPLLEGPHRAPRAQRLHEDLPTHAAGILSYLPTMPAHPWAEALLPSTGVAMQNPRDWYDRFVVTATYWRVGLDCEDAVRGRAVGVTA
jgi:hypothetical protein